MQDIPDRPSIVFHGFNGGIVNGPDIAVRLAKIILAEPGGPAGSNAGLALQAKDTGGKWSIFGSSDGGHTECLIEIRKSDGAVLALPALHPTDAVPNPTVAERFAASLADNAGLPGESDRQSPFTIVDNGDAWVVRGSYNADRAAEGPGPFCLEVRKRDARVLDMGFEGVIHTPAAIAE